MKQAKTKIRPAVGWVIIILLMAACFLPLLGLVR